MGVSRYPHVGFIGLFGCPHIESGVYKTLSIFTKSLAVHRGLQVPPHWVLGVPNTLTLDLGVYRGLWVPYGALQVPLHWLWVLYGGPQVP